jgi:hypothetical protein
MTPQQLSALKTDINAPGNAAALSGAISTRDGSFIANFYNAAASPVFLVFKTLLGKHDITESSSLDPDGTTARAFDWASPGGYIARSQGERDAFREIFNATDSCRPDLLGVRAGFDDIFSGSGVGAVANRNHIKNVSRRSASRVEKLLATGGNGAAATPATAGFVGPLSGQDVLDALDAS